MKISMLMGALLSAAVASASLAEEAKPGEEGSAGSDWREQYKNMTPQEKEEFNRVRREIKAKVNVMTEEERAAFRQHIQSQQGSAPGDTIYIKAMPQDEVEVFENKVSEEDDSWKALSYQEKRSLLKDEDE